MLSKNKIKLIHSLNLKKNRLSEGLFIAEGKKIITDLIRSDFLPVEIFSSEATSNEFTDLNQNNITVVEKRELEKISSLKSTPEVIALFRIPETIFKWKEIEEDLSLVLDSVQDPGNLGTIVRTADWFGIKNIICSEDTADIYNPKTVQSTMGAIARVNIHYRDLKEFLTTAMKQNIPLYGTFMEGENIFTTELTNNGIVVFGNEGKGISKENESLLTTKLSIPSYPVSVRGSESLNVAIAASIICAEFRRRRI